MKIRNLTLACSTLALATASFSASAAEHRTFSNPSSISIPDNGTTTSTINVSGLTGDVQSVTVTLRGLSHTFPDDIDIILQAPNGQQMLLMSDAGGSFDVNGVTLVFTAGAISSLPDASQIVGGVYLPTNYNTTTSESISNTDLTVFNGPAANANGTWSLQVVDDLGIDSGSISSGWILDIITEDPTTCASEGYTGTKLYYCVKVCESGYTGATLDTWIRRWLDRYGNPLPYCAIENPAPSIR